MGFKPKRDYKLTFEDPELDGLEVVARKVSVDELLGLLDKLQAVAAASDAPPGAAGTREAVTELCGTFAGMLVSWNVEDEHDQPVPATADGLRTQDLDFLMKVISGFVAGVSEAPPPLPRPSANGVSQADQESTLGLAASSVSLPSSAGPG